MYSVTGAAKWDMLTGKQQDVSGTDGDFFSQVLKTSMFGAFGTGGGVQDLLSQLSERFPSATMSEGVVPSGTKGMEKYFGSKAGDHVAIGSSTLQSMLGNSGLVKSVEDAISAFLEGTGSNTGEAAEGTYMQRRVSITVTTIRFSVAQRSGESGELLTSNELKTTLQDKIKELVNAFFNTSAAETDDDSEAETDASDAGTEAAKAAAAAADFKNQFGFSSTLWSMELYYSSSYVQTKGQGSDIAASAQSWQMSAAFSGSFSQFTGNFLPQAIYSGFGTGGMTGPFTSLLGQTLSGFGMTSSGVERGQGGYSLNLRQSRNLVAELMELFDSRVLGDAAAEVASVGEATEAEGSAQAAESGEAGAAESAAAAGTNAI